MRVLHSADWQLSKTFGRFEPDLRAALAEARFDAIDAIGQAARAHEAGHVLVAGDVFDTEGPEDRTIVQALSRMGRYPCRWWLLPGKRLDRGRFVWPVTATGTVTLTPAQLSMLLEGIDWRRPERTFAPTLAG